MPVLPKDFQSLHDDADGLVDADHARAGRNPDRQVVPAGLDELRQIEVERLGPALGVVPIVAAEKLAIEMYLRITVHRTEV